MIEEETNRWVRKKFKKENWKHISQKVSQSGLEIIEDF